MLSIKISLRSARQILCVWCCCVALGCVQRQELPTSSSAGRDPSELQQGGKSESLVVWVVDDTAWAETLQREWNADSALPIEVVSYQAGEVVELIRTGEMRSLRGDVVLFPTVLLGELAEAERIEAFPRYVQASPETMVTLIPADTFPLLRAHATRWGREQQAVTLGGNVWMLLYRADLWEQLQRPLPRTWSELLAGSQAMAERVPAWRAAGLVPESFRPWSTPTTVPDLAQVLLAHAAPYARHRSSYSTLFDYQSMEPLIGNSPFVRALDEQLQLWALGGDFPADEWDEQEAERRFWAGEVGVLMWRSCRADPAPQPLSDSGLSDTEPRRCGLIPLPGSSESYRLTDGVWETLPQPRGVAYLSPDDRLGGVLVQSVNHRAAWSFLGRLVSSDRSAALLGGSCRSGPFRQSQLAQPGDWLRHWENQPQEDWKLALLNHYSAEDLLIGPRIPGSLSYLSALGGTVRGALLGQQSASDALATAAAQWREITAEYGVGAQVQANRANLGLDP